MNLLRHRNYTGGGLSNTTMGMIAVSMNGMPFEEGSKALSQTLKIFQQAGLSMHGLRAVKHVTKSATPRQPPRTNALGTHRVSAIAAKFIAAHSSQKLHDLLPQRPSIRSTPFIPIIRQAPCFSERPIRDFFPLTSPTVTSNHIIKQPILTRKRPLSGPTQTSLTDFFAKAPRTDQDHSSARTGGLKRTASEMEINIDTNSQSHGSSSSSSSSSINNSHRKRSSSNMYSSNQARGTKFPP